MRGIYISGVVTMTTDGILRDPVYLSAEDIARGIDSGMFSTGVFNNVNVFPPAEEWPEEWRHLKENENNGT